MRRCPGVKLKGKADADLPTHSREWLWKIPRCVTGYFSVLSHFVNRLTAVLSKRSFTNRDIFVMKP